MFSIKFGNPKKSQIVLFDKHGSEDLERMVVGDLDHEILHIRQEVFYLTPQILFRILFNLKHIKKVRHGAPTAWHNPIGSLRKLIGEIYRIYLLSCIQYMQPKAVVTLVDNTYSFQAISRIYKEAQFIAIQNGVRLRRGLKDLLPPYPQPGSIMSMPILVCFGKFDVDLYRTYNHQIDMYYPKGSLRAGYYKSFLSKPRSDHEFDLCLISEGLGEILLGNYVPSEKKAVFDLNHFLSRYIKEEKKTLCIALRSNNKNEEEYYLNQFGEHITFIKSNRELMSSYEAVDRSSVAVAFVSTLAYEAFGWGAKVLFCNYSGDDLYDFPCPGFWFTNKPDYALFKERLNYLMTLDLKEYHRQAKDSATYIMNNDGQPPHEFVRELILKQLDANVER